MLIQVRVFANTNYGVQSLDSHTITVHLIVNKLSQNRKEKISSYFIRMWLLGGTLPLNNTHARGTLPEPFRTLLEPSVPY